MSWEVYRLVLRLHTPLHIGRGNISYLQRSYPYVTGRVLRGALVSRVARNQNIIGERKDDPYSSVSKTFAQYLTFTYFYPALKTKDDWVAEFPWNDNDGFQRRYLSSYTGTALDYPQQSAAEGLLREVEFISPHTLDTGEPVYLMGYIFIDEGRLKQDKYDWMGGFKRLQLGGERGYGWGETRLIDQGIQHISSNDKLFGIICFNLDSKRPIVCLEENQPVLAHTGIKVRCIAGNVEPIVGREWRADKGKHIGQHLPFDGLYFEPGSKVLCKTDFIIAEGGYWSHVRNLQ